MKRTKYAARALLFIIAILAPFVVSSGIANASSDYDNVLKASNAARISSHAVLIGGQPADNCAAQDVSTSWAGILATQSYWDNAVYGNGTNFTEVTSALNTTLGNGSGWVVTERTTLVSIGIGNYGWAVGDYLTQISFTASNTNSVDFATVNGHKYAYMHNTDSTPIYTVVIGVKELAGTDTCQIGVAVSRKIAGNATPWPMIIDEHLVGSDNQPGDITSWRQLIVNSPINYPSGYAGESASNTLPAAKYVAMGDSFSSGEGNAPFESGTDVGGVNECHRSSQAYPRLLLDELGLRTAFVACSGATTHNVLYGGAGSGAWGESPQIDALSADTEVVTITIGGNDVGFSDYAYACTITLCGPSTFDYNYIMNEINDPDFILHLIETYETILDRARNAQLYVVNYPHLAAENSDVCGQMDMTGAWAVQSQLNAVVADAVDYVLTSNLNLRIHYIDANRLGSPFIGKHLCNGGVSDFNSLVSPVGYSFHPNAVGHQDYATVIGGGM